MQTRSPTTKPTTKIAAIYRHRLNGRMVETKIHEAKLNSQDERFVVVNDDLPYYRARSIAEALFMIDDHIGGKGAT